jgi:hypothetical protein
MHRRCSWKRLRKICRLLKALKVVTFHFHKLNNHRKLPLVILNFVLSVIWEQEVPRLNNKWCIHLKKYNLKVFLYLLLQGENFLDQHNNQIKVPLIRYHLILLFFHQKCWIKKKKLLEVPQKNLKRFLKELWILVNTSESMVIKTNKCWCLHHTCARNLKNQRRNLTMRIS